MLSIPYAEISRVLIADSRSWQTVRNVSPVALGLPLGPNDGPIPGLAFMAEDSTWTYVPLTSVRGIGTSHRILTQGEVEAEAEEARDLEARLFEWQHRTDRKTYDASLKAQKGICPKCRAGLADFAITHYDESSKTILCAGCTPFQHRYGSPA